MTVIRKRSAALRAGIAAVAASSVALGLGLTASSAAVRTATLTSARPHAVKGGTVYFAEGAQAPPDFIFPFMSFADSSVTNISDFQYLMYRPLYFFGQDGKPVLNTAVSLGDTPTYSNGDTVVSVSLKNYKWSDGESVTAQDVVFWMNLLKVEKDNWYAFAPGTIPDDVKSIVVDSPTKLTFTLTGSVNPFWFTYNELAQLTPLPMAWDISATGQKPGSQACGTASYQAVTIKQSSSETTVTPVSAAATSCQAVYTYLEKESGFDPNNPKAPNNSLSSYATNPLWAVVDGPFKLSSFDTSGKAVFVPNPSYSGPVKASISQFVELPFTSTTAEFNALVGGQLTVGFLPFEDVTAPAVSPTVPGPNNPRLTGFNIYPWNTYGINYFPINFHSSADNGIVGKIFSQLYFRQAMQSLVDQSVYITKIFKGYGVPTYGPVPVLPKNAFASPYEQSDPYPYSVSKATSLLKSNGWTVNPGGTSVCADASKCGVPAGTPLSFTMEYVNNSPTEQELFETQQASFSQVGIKLSLTTTTFDTAIGDAAPCAAGTKACNWEMIDWGGGWVYAPDYYPTGEDLFQTGAGSNNSNFSDPAVNQLIHATDFGTANLYQYENTVAKDLPVIWQPNQTYQIQEVQSTLAGTAPWNPYLNILPEDWYFTKS